MSPARWLIGVLWSELVTADAVGLIAHIVRGPEQVFPMRHRLKMTRVHAESYPACVVQLLPVRDRAPGQAIHHAVRVDLGLRVSGRAHVRVLQLPATLAHVAAP